MRLVSIVEVEGVWMADVRVLMDSKREELRQMVPYLPKPVYYKLKQSSTPS